MFDMVLMDMAMPVMGGVTATEVSRYPQPHQLSPETAVHCWKAAVLQPSTSCNCMFVQSLCHPAAPSSIP